MTALVERYCMNCGQRAELEDGLCLDCTVGDPREERYFYGDLTDLADEAALEQRDNLDDLSPCWICGASDRTMCDC